MFAYPLVAGNSGLTSGSAAGGGVAFFAHIGGFVFGVVIASALLALGRARRTAAGRAAVATY